MIPDFDDPILRPVCLPPSFNQRFENGRPPDHDVLLQRLPEPIAQEARELILEGTLPYYHSPRLETWVPYLDLAVGIGFGRRLHDPASLYHVPPDALFPAPYLTEHVTAQMIAVSPALAAAVARAGHVKALLHRVQRRVEDHRYSWRIPMHESTAGPIEDLIRGNMLYHVPCEHGWWVAPDELAPLVPAGESFDDPASEWFVGPHDRADDAEVERLHAKHIQEWPELYNGSLGATQGRTRFRWDTSRIGAFDPNA